MNPSRNPSWRVVTQRLASAIVALARPPPGGMTWSSRSVSSLLISDANEPVLARTQPARSTTPDALDDARQRAAERGRQGRHDAGHRLGVGGFGGPQLGRVEGAGRGAQPADRDALDLRPVDEAAPRGLLGTPAGDRGGGAQRGADQEAGLPDPVVAPRRPVVVRRLGRSVIGTATASSTCSTSGKADPNSRPARAWKRAGVTGRQLEVGRRSRRRVRLEPVDRRAARPAPTPSPSPNRRSPRARRPAPR